MNHSNPKAGRPIHLPPRSHRQLRISRPPPPPPQMPPPHRTHHQRPTRLRPHLPLAPNQCPQHVHRKHHQRNPHQLLRPPVQPLWQCQLEPDHRATQRRNRNRMPNGIHKSQPHRPSRRSFKPGNICNRRNMVVVEPMPKTQHPGRQQQDIERSIHIDSQHRRRISVRHLHPNYLRCCFLVRSEPQAWVGRSLSLGRSEPQPGISPATKPGITPWILSTPTQNLKASL